MDETVEGMPTQRRSLAAHAQGPRARHLTNRKHGHVDQVLEPLPEIRPNRSRGEITEFSDACQPDHRQRRHRPATGYLRPAEIHVGYWTAGGCHQPPVELYG